MNWMTQHAQLSIRVRRTKSSIRCDRGLFTEKMNIKELIRKANAGSITPHEIKQVYEALINNEGDAYDLLLILGRAGATQHKNIVEKYLNTPDDSMLARLALQILCRYWGLAKEYEIFLEQFVRGVDWDDEEDVRLMAITCAADILKDEDKPVLLSIIFDVFNDEDEDDITRGAAYETLAIVSGVSVIDLPQPLHFDLKNDVDQNVINKIKTKIRGKG